MDDLRSANDRFYAALNAAFAGDETSEVLVALLNLHVCIDTWHVDDVVSL